MKLTIITINYNNKKGLRKTILSVFNQTWQDFEYIIIDGNSTDGSANLLETYSSQIDYWVSEPDTGIYNAMNKGIDKANGEYLLFLNSGDFLFNNHVFENVISQISSNYQIYYGNLIVLKDKISRKLTFPSKITFNYFYSGGYIPHPSSFIRRTLFTKIGLYNQDYTIVADWDFFLRSVCKYNVPCKYLNLTVTNFDGNGISSKKKFIRVKKKEKQKILKLNFPTFLEDYEELARNKKFLELNRFKSLIFLESYSTAQKINTVWFFSLKLIYKLIFFKINLRKQRI